MDKDCNFICRGCLSEGRDINNMNYLFADFTEEGIKSEEFRQIVDFYSKYMFTEIVPLHEHQNWLCNICFETVWNFHKFRKICIKSNATLSEQFNRVDEVKDELEKNEESDGLCDDARPFFDDNYTPEELDNENTSSKSSESASKMFDVKKSAINNKNVARSKRSSSSFTKHSKRKQAKKEKNVCTICNKRFYTLHKYEAHIRVHQGLKPYECKECQKQFVKHCTYQVHMRIHHSSDVHEAETFICGIDDCGKAYKVKRSLRTHMSIAHLNMPRKQYHSNDAMCELCGKLFQSKTALRDHLLRHNDVKNFQCHLCPRSFVTESGRKEHLIRHEGIKNFICGICGAAKTRNSELKKHINFHTRAKKYPCQTCGLVFYETSKLTRHTKVVHLNERRHKCIYCEKSFGCSTTLKSHTMIHTGEKPFECETCNKKFIQRTAYRTHMKTHDKLGRMPAALTHFST